MVVEEMLIDSSSLEMVWSILSGRLKVENILTLFCKWLFMCVTSLWNSDLSKFPGRSRVPTAVHNGQNLDVPASSCGTWQDSIEDTLGPFP